MNLDVKNAEKFKSTVYDENFIAGDKLKNSAENNFATYVRRFCADPTAYEAIENVSKNEETINRNIVYICSPIIRDDIERIHRKDRGYCRFVNSKGYIPISTHLIFPQFMDKFNREECERAIEMGLELLLRCDELWCFGLNPTGNMILELECAKKYKIETKYFTDTCKEISEKGVVRHE